MFFLVKGGQIGPSPHSDQAPDVTTASADLFCLSGTDGALLPYVTRSGKVRVRRNCGPSAASLALESIARAFAKADGRSVGTAAIVSQQFRSDLAGVENFGNHLITEPPMLLPQRPEPRDAVPMPDRPFPAVEALIRRVQRIAASRPDPMHILAQTISMTGEIGADPYAVLGVLVEGAVLTIVQHIPAEQQMETAAMLIQLLEERLKARGVPGGGR